MALTRNHHAHAKTVQKNVLNHSNKENIPPTREKKYVSTSALFKAAAPSRVEKRQAVKSTKFAMPPSVIIPLKAPALAKKTGLGKTILIKRQNIASPVSPKSNLHPLVSNLNSTLASYRDDVSEASRVVLNPVHDDLVQRLATGATSPGGTSIHNLAARFEEASELSEALGTPLGKHEVKVRFKDSKGRVTHGQVALGVTVTRFEKLVKDKERELNRLWQEWHDVRQEIATLGAELLDDSAFPTNFALEAAPATSVSATHGWTEHIAGLRADVSVLCEQSRDVVAKEGAEDVKVRKASKVKWLDMLKEAL